MSKPNNKRAVFELVLVAIILFLGWYAWRNRQNVTPEAVSDLRAKYHDTVSMYKDRLGIEIASKEVVELRADELREIDSAKYAELSTRYKQLKSIVGSSTIVIKHDTVKLWFASEDYDMPTLGLVEYQDSCVYAGFDFTDSGTYVNYVLASQSITSTILREKGKIINDVNISSQCGRIAQVKTFTFVNPKKKWFEKPLVVGGIGLGAGVIGTLILLQ